MIEKKLKCVCIFPYNYGRGKLEAGVEYIVYKCYDGFYRVCGLALDKFDFKNLFDIKEEIKD